MKLKNLLYPFKKETNLLKKLVFLVKNGKSDSYIIKMLSSDNKSSNPLSIPYTPQAVLSDLRSIRLYETSYNPSDNELANLIVLQMYHVTSRSVSKIVSNASYSPVSQDKLSFMGTFCTIQNSLNEFRETGVSKYEVSTCGDQKTCKTCAKHNGKNYFVSKAVVEKNLPPFCEKCRCIILPVFR